MNAALSSNFFASIIEAGNLMEMKKLFGWESASIIFSVFGTISLFGEIGVITFSQWLANVVEAYRHFVHPIFRFISEPLMRILDLRILPWQIDCILVIYFFVNRFIADMIVCNILSPSNITEYDRKRLRKILFYWNSRRIRRILIWAYAMDKRYRDNWHLISSIVRNLILFFALCFLVYVFSDVDVSYKEDEYEVYHIVLFFMALYMFPIFVGLQIVLIFAGESTLFVIAYAMYILRLPLISKIASRKPKFTPKFKVEYQLFLKQINFDAKFTVFFLFLIGLNYRFLGTG